MMIIITTIIIIILSSSSSSSFNIPKTLLEDDSHSFKVASTQFHYLHIDNVNPQTPLTVFVPSDEAFADASSAVYESLPFGNKYFTFQCQMLIDYLSPSLLLKTAKDNHLHATAGTEIMGNQKYMLNITTANDSVVVVSNGLVQAMVTRTIYDHSPIVVYGISKILVPDDLPTLPTPPAESESSVFAASAATLSGLCFLPFYSFFFLVLSI